MRTSYRITLLVIALGLAGACSSSSKPVVVGGPAKSTPALHNVHAIDPQLVSGAVPEGDAAFDELKAMGVKTIISVDGAAPDVTSAEARGIRYVHIPITYAQVSERERLEIARAVRDLPGPVYIHCHHGKHRSPAATAAAAVTLGRITPEQGVAFMKTAGTAPSYAGLYACVLAATPADAASIDAAPDEFPSLRKPAGIVAAMLDVDLAFDHLTAIRDAGWKVPADQPDLVPAAEAGRLVDSLRFSIEDPRARSHGAAFQTMLDDAIARATALEEGIVRGDKADGLTASLKQLDTSCKDCHAKYRNQR